MWVSMYVHLRSFDAGIKSNIAEYRALTALRDTLLPKLVSVELRVNDAEHFIGKTKS